MFNALKNQDDRAALHAGTNLLSMVTEQSEPRLARQVQAELQPVRVRNEKLMVAHSLVLRESALLTLE